MFDKFKKYAISHRIHNAALYSSVFKNTNRTNLSIRKQIDAILPKGLAINSTNGQGDTVLHIATFFGSYECVKCLLERPVDINQKNKNGYVPFANTFISEDLLSADLLLSRPEIDFNIESSNTFTILEQFNYCFQIGDKDNYKRYSKWDKAKMSEILLKLFKGNHSCISGIDALQSFLKILIDVSDNQGMGKKDFRSAMNLAAMHYIFCTFKQASDLTELRLFEKDYADFLPNPLNLQNLQLRKLHPYYDDNKVFLSIAGYIRPYLSNMNTETIDKFSHIIKYYLEPTFGTFIKSMAILDDDELLKKAGQGYKPVDYHEKIKEIDLKSIPKIESKNVSSALLDSGVLYPPISACIKFIVSVLIQCSFK